MLTDERKTPDELFIPLDNEFHFDVDVAAAYDNFKCEKYYSIADSGLTHEWIGNCFMNPPYSNIKRWLRKAKEEADKGALVVCILPCDPSTKWFHRYIWDADKNDWREGIKVRFPTKRYKFGDNINSAKFATMIVIMKNHDILR